MEETLFNDFQSLPETIKTWLASDHCAIYISEINKKLGLKGSRRSIIPTLVLQLVTQDLIPQDFIKELAENLNVGYPIAKSLTEEIEAKILHPIELGLRRDAGVDIKLIYMEAAAGKPTAPVAPLAMEKIPTPAPAPTAEISRPPIPPSPAEALAKEGKPAISLREGGLPSKPATPAAPAETEEKPAISPRVIYQERSLENPPAPALQAPIAKPEIKPTSARVVHYNSQITPLNDNSENLFNSYVVDLRKV